MFQSHNGAIAAREFHFATHSLNSFQSHNGAIAAQQRKPLTERHFAVSIPQWCDCCAGGYSDTGVPPCVSIPQWCDCCFGISETIAFVRLVSIPQWCDCCESYRIRSICRSTGFNPTMVRLLPSISVHQILRQLKFQSHNGAIAASSCIATQHQPVWVSIPQWCDCCHGCSN